MTIPPIPLTYVDARHGIRKREFNLFGPNSPRLAALVCSRVIGREPPVMAKVTVSGLFHQPHELFPADADQPLVVTSLEIDLRLLGQAVVDDGVHAVGGTERRDGTALTVLEEGTDLL